MLRAVRIGRVDPRTMKWGYDTAAKPFDAAASLEKVRSGTALASVLDEFEPPFAHFSRYRNLLKAYRALAAAGEPPSVPSLPKGQSKVVPGQAWEGVPALAARLRTVGDLKDAAPAGATAYSGALVDAVKAFQERHGLDADGVIGQGTIRAQNVPIAQRVRQIELAMERERWLPELSGHPNVFVNVALFRLWGDDGKGSEPLRMNVVVGKALNHQTPVFVEQMEYVIFRPYWNPPIGITREEILPKARRDPGYLGRERLEIVATNADNAPELPPTPENLAAVASGKLVLRQKPGPGNSLGLAKFMFPNDEAVYMHGTPAQELFSRVRRDFSHGCIRLEDPARMAEWVLRDQPEWDPEKIAKAMAGESPTRATLKDKLTVVLFYTTVHVNSDGMAYFVDDIYGHDKTLDTALGRGYPYPAS
jgi:L,D-transpeptidase YcbB